MPVTAEREEAMKCEDAAGRRASNADFPEVAPILDRVIAGLNAILDQQLVGIYVYGSLVDGDFDAGISDIDMVVVMKREIDAALFDALDELHEAIVEDNPAWHDRLELVYIAASGLRRFRTRTSRIAVISPGEPFHCLDAGDDWLISWYGLRESGLALRGPDIESLLDPIPLADYLAGLREHVNAYPDMAATTDSKSWLSYIALTVARALYTVAHGRPTSKRKAASWAMQRDPKWASLLESALNWRADADCDDLTADEIRPCVQAYLRDMLPQFSE